MHKATNFVLSKSLMKNDMEFIYGEHDSIPAEGEQDSCYQ